MSAKQQVLILRAANSARSQLGEGLLRELAGERFDVYSAGARSSSVNLLSIPDSPIDQCDSRFLTSAR